MDIGQTDQVYGYASQMRRLQPSSEDIFSKIMQETDIDGDGTISSDELSALDEAQQTRLLEADSDGDGLISEDELMTKIAEHIAAKEQMGGLSAEEIVNKVIEDADVDGDGAISTEELSALDERLQQRLVDADTDGDGILTQEELETQVADAVSSREEMGVPTTADMVSQIMQESDADGDGVISEEELSAVDTRRQQMLSEADTDSDGSITEEELTTQLSEGEGRHSRVPPHMQDMTLNGFKEMLGSLIDEDVDPTQSTATQIQDYLGGLGLDETEITDLMTLLENRRFDVTA